MDTIEGLPPEQISGGQLMAALQGLQDHITALQAQCTLLLPPQGETTHSAYPESQVSLPNKFTGDPCCFLGFINHCCLTFHFYPRSNTLDMAKVRQIICLLPGDTLAWVSPLQNQQTPSLTTLKTLSRAWKKDFVTHIWSILWSELSRPSDRSGTGCQVMLPNLGGW